MRKLYESSRIPSGAYIIIEPTKFQFDFNKGDYLYIGIPNNNEVSVEFIDSNNRTTRTEYVPFFLVKNWIDNGIIIEEENWRNNPKSDN